MQAINLFAIVDGQLSNLDSNLNVQEAIAIHNDSDLGSSSDEDGDGCDQVTNGTRTP